MAPDRDGAAAAARAVEACHAPLRRVWDALDAELWTSLAAAVRRGGERHAELALRHGLSGPCPPAHAEATDRLEAYVFAVSREIQAPLLATLREYEPSARVRRAFDAAAAAIAAGCRGLPDRVDRAWGPEALKPHASDSLGRRAAKALARVVSPARHPEGRRAAPVRPVAQRHVVYRVVPLAERCADGALRAWAEWVGAVEAAWTEWVAEALPNVVAVGGAGPFEEGDEPPAPEETWADVARAAARLSDALESIAVTPPLGSLATEVRSALDRHESELAAELAVAGSFVLRGQAPPAPPPESLAGVAESWEGWSRWIAQALERLSMHHAIFDALGVAHDAIDRLEREMLTHVREPLVAESAAAAANLRALAAKVPPSGDATFEHGLREGAEAVLAAVPNEADAPLAEQERAVRSAADHVVQALQSAVAGLPARVDVHDLDEARALPRRPPHETRAVYVREVASEAFDVVRVERIRTAPMAVFEAVGRARSVFVDASEVATFGFEAALAELDSDEEGAPGRARDLAVESLERAAGVLEGVTHTLEVGIERARATVAADVAAGARSLVRRALAHRMRAQLLDARSRLKSRWRAFARDAAPYLDRWTRRLLAAWRVARATADRLLRRGRALVGEGGDDGLATAKGRSLGLEDGVADHLPLVYRRLFSTAPVSDPALLVGRERELTEAEARWRIWKQSEGVPWIVCARPGTGLTSFLGILSQRLRAAGATVVDTRLERRYRSEEALAARLGDVFGLPTPASMNELATSILQAPSGTVPDVILVEGLEHVYLRTPSGTDVVERLLTLMAETEPRIFWIAGVTSSAWQLIEKTEPTAVAQVDTLMLPTLSGDDVHTAILQRHRLSGLRLRYDEPTEGRAMLRYRLRRTRGTAAHQQMLESDFFARLHRSSSGNLRLALHDWLRSLRVGASDAELVVALLEPEPFAFLESLDLTQNFTLKAFLEHRTLTLEEHDLVFRIPRQESFQIFEALGNRRVIEVLDGDAESGVSEVREEHRYSIRPLLTGAVANHLARRNIVH